MLEPEKRDPRTPGDRRMYLYFNYSESGSLRWYVKVSRKGRRIGISEEYGTPAFDAACEAGVATLGGVARMRRVKTTIRPDQPERRYLYVDVSQRGQLRYYVQLRNKLPKIRIKAEFGTTDFETRSMLQSPLRSPSMAMKATTSTRRSSGTRSALLCRPRRPNPARCAGTGTVTSRVIIGLVISVSATTAWPRRLGSSVPG